MASINLNIPVWKWATAIAVFAIGFHASKRIEWRFWKWKRERSNGEG